MTTKKSVLAKGFLNTADRVQRNRISFSHMLHDAVVDYIHGTWSDFLLQPTCIDFVGAASKVCLHGEF